MLGYNDLRDPSVSGLFRFLARTGDRIMKMQIVRICFGPVSYTHLHPCSASAAFEGSGELEGHQLHH